MYIGTYITYTFFLWIALCSKPSQWNFDHHNLYLSSDNACSKTYILQTETRNWLFKNHHNYIEV